MTDLRGCPVIEQRFDPAMAEESLRTNQVYREHNSDRDAVTSFAERLAHISFGSSEI